jgi:phosphatidylserine/phosphatidylglycerophosphate/cardiolipin synthase-like enzyme
MSRRHSSCRSTGKTRNVSETRDYAIATRHPHEVAEVIECFDADWKRATFTPHPDSALIWCNSNGRERFAHFIDRAQHSLWLQNERYQDAVIIERVVRAARRGVHVRIVARPAAHVEGGKADRRGRGTAHHERRRRQGAQAEGNAAARQMLLADGARAIVGSINLAPGSFDARRELAIEVDDAHVVGPLERVAKRDWDHSQALDLTDEGLMARPQEARQGIERRRSGAGRRAGQRQAGPQAPLSRARGQIARAGFARPTICSRRVHKHSALRAPCFGPEGSQHEKHRAAARFSCGKFNEARRCLIGIACYAA